MSGQNDGAIPVTRLISSLGTSPSLAQTVNAARKISKMIDHRVAINIAILRNITVEPGLTASLQLSAAEAGLHANIHLADFDRVESAVYDPESDLYSFAPDLIVVALHLHTMAPALVTNFASLPPAKAREIAAIAVERLLSIARAIRETCGSLILVHNFELPSHAAYGILDLQMPHGQRRLIAATNESLANGIANIAGAYVVDVEQMVAELGQKAAVDHRYWHIARAPYTFALQRRLSFEYIKFGSALKGKTKKCLVLDCDNTLWGGIIGEDGFAGIALSTTSPGSAFLEMHAAILNLYHRGVLLALASKNNEKEVMDVFARHPSSLLKTEHFVARRINWQDKAANLREIAAELNIGLDSLVFVDDNPFECNFVREVLPEVTVVDLPRDPSRFAHIIRGLHYFDTLTISSEDRRRSEMYRASASRAVLKAESGSMEQYLQSLEMRLTVGRADAFSIPRIAQLTQKTNQFNLTTQRYSETDLIRLLDDPCWNIYYAEVTDRFDNAGIIAVALVQDQPPKARIDTYLMSCRVIGRGVERAFMSIIAQDCLERNIEVLKAEYIETSKNVPARSFLKDYGFAEVTESGGQRWYYNLENSLPKTPGWFSAVVWKTPQRVRS